MSKQVEILGPQAQSVYHRISFVMVQSGSIYFTCVSMQLLLYALGMVGLSLQ